MDYFVNVEKRRNVTEASVFVPLDVCITEELSKRRSWQLSDEGMRKTSNSSKSYSDINDIILKQMCLDVVPRRTQVEQSVLSPLLTSDDKRSLVKAVQLPPLIPGRNRSPFG